MLNSAPSFVNRTVAKKRASGREIAADNELYQAVALQILSSIEAARAGLSAPGGPHATRRILRLTRAARVAHT
jgi:hypothetical protein